MFLFTLAEFKLQTNYPSEVNKSSRYKFGVWLMLATNSFTIDSSVIEDVITDETNLGPKFVWILDLYLDDLSVSDR